MGAAFLQKFKNAGEARGPLEKQVLQQVGHAGFTIALVARADQISHVDCDGIHRRIGQKQKAKTVGQPVLGDTLE